jgi:TM2 domain-containing membrane protein YozV
LANDAVSRPVAKAVLLPVTLVAGVFGAHKFYLGKHWQGILYFLFSWTLIPALVALVEFLIYAFTRRETLQKETAHLRAGITAAVLGYAGLAATSYIAISGSNDFRYRARVAGAVMSVSPWREAVSDYYGRTKRFPISVNELGPVQDDSQRSRERVTLGANGVLTVTFLPNTGALAGKTMTVSPSPNADGSLTWKCRGTVENRYRPASCRD